ncbi:uncharacterized protein SOCE26_017460 [Sorangium cellulosum]|uniref:Uncharacterized protein n=1 Tax=Sorangium cellulosum TaxID=56 RepID=A0A2L0EM19_SORCE|nr:uncharacterized protein SOCE26_017460 [Sorangium cellulosum]
MCCQTGCDGARKRWTCEVTRRAVALGDEVADRGVHEALGRLLGLPVAPEALPSLRLAGPCL